MNEAERRYKVHDQELLAIMECFKHWRHYLEGSRQPFRVQTNHNNLRYFFQTKTLNSRQARWAETLAAYDFTLEHRPGIRNPADTPLRQPDYKLSDMQEHHVGMLPTLQRKLALGIVKSEDPQKESTRL